VDRLGRWAAAEEYDETCVDPPCPPESLPPVEQLPAAAPFLLVALAILLGVGITAAGLTRVIRTRAQLGTGLLLTAAPVLLVARTEVLPHVATPCWAGEIPGVCADTEKHGVD
jgi:hypothetical protein